MLWIYNYDDEVPAPSLYNVCMTHDNTGQGIFGQYDFTFYRLAMTQSLCYIQGALTNPKNPKKMLPPINIPIINNFL